MGKTRALLQPHARAFASICMAVVMLGACTEGLNELGAPFDTGTTLDQALANHIAGRLDIAKTGYESVLAEDPGNHFALYNLGLIAQSLGDNVTAEDFYRRTLEIDPEFEAALFNLAIVRADLGDPDEAIKLYKKAIEVNPASAGAHLNLGFLYIDIGQKKKGKAEIEEAVRLDPSLSTRVPEKPQKAHSPSPSPTD